MLFRVVVALAFQDPRGALRRSIYLKRLLIPGSIKMITLDPRLCSLLSWERLPRGARAAGGEGGVLAHLFKNEEVKTAEVLSGWSYLVAAGLWGSELRISRQFWPKAALWGQLSLTLSS